ncbi:MAG: hypothetical protein WCD00_10580, partial [Desulfuromonadaceae bacterium]
MMDRILNISPRLLFWVTLCSVALTAVLLNFSFPAFTNGRQVYNDIVVGEIAIADAYKHGDLLFSFFAVGCFSVFWIVLALLAVLLRKRPETVSTAVCQDSSRDERMNIWGMLSFSAMLLLVRKNGFWFEPILPLLLLAPYSLLIRKNNASYASRATIAWGASVWGVFFSAAGILALIHFVMPMLMVGRKDSLSVIPVFLAGAWGVIVLALMVKKSAIPRTMALGSQILMPLLLLPFFTRVIEQRGITSGNLFPLYTKIIGLALALGLIAYNIRLFITWRKSDDSGGNCFFVPSVMAFSAFLSFTPLSMNKIDLFHTGELLLAWQQIFEKGQFPYTGFAWARGVSDAVAGFLNVIVFEGNFSTFQYAFNLYGML